MASVKGNLEALEAIRHVQRQADGLHTSGDDSGVLRRYFLATMPAGTPAGIGGASLGCFRWLPRAASQALPVSVPLSFGFGLDPAFTSPGVQLAVALNESSSSRSTLLVLRPGDWFDAPQGFNSFSVIALDGADTLLQSTIPQSRWPQGYVAFWIATAVGARPSWATSAAKQPLQNQVRILNSCQGTTFDPRDVANATWAIHCPGRGYVRVRIMGLTAGGATISQPWRATLRVMPLPKFAAGNGNLATIDDTYSRAGLDEPASDDTVDMDRLHSLSNGYPTTPQLNGEIPVSPGMNLVSIAQVNAATVPSAYFAVFEWVGTDSPGLPGREVQLFDSPSAANASITADIYTEDIENLSIDLIASGGAIAAATAFTLTAYEDNDAIGTPTGIFCTGTLSGGNNASIPVGPGSAPNGVGVTAVVGNSGPLPKRMQVLIAAAGAGVTVRVSIRGRKRVQ